MVEKYCFPKEKKNALSFHILPSFAFENVSWPTRSPLSTGGYFMPLISEQIPIKTITCSEQVASQLPSIISGWPSSQRETQRIERQGYKRDGLGRILFQVGTENMMNFWCCFQLQDSKNIKGTQWWLRKSNCHHSAHTQRRQEEVLSMPSNTYPFTSQSSVSEIKEFVQLSETVMFSMLSALASCIHFPAYKTPTQRRCVGSVDQVQT